MPDITTKGARQALKKRREPHWMRIRQGQYLGFRRGAETWVVRFRNSAGKQEYEALTEVTEYDDALKAAETWLQHRGASGARAAKRGTVREALESYLDWLESQGRDRTAKTIRTKFKQVVWDDPLGELQLSQLAREDVREWRDRLKDGRLPRSVNRIVRDLRAGLNRAVKEGHIGNPAAWKIEPLVDDTDDGGKTAVFLTHKQRAALIEAANDEGGLFFRGLELTGARPGELAAATVADFDPAGGTIRLSHRKGRPARLRTRAVVLSHEGSSFFKEQAKGKLPAAPLFISPDRKPWDRHEWARAFREARKQANKDLRGKGRIPAKASAYSFRHARISELLQVHGVDPLTVALQTGTSLRMIEKAYFRFIAPALREKLAAIDEV